MNEEVKEEPKQKWYKSSRFIAIICVILIMGIFNQFFTIVIVSGSSMEPTYKTGSIGFAEKKYNELNRFDVVVIDSFSADRILIKRIIGLPGETIEYKNHILYVNGIEVEDSFSSITSDYSITVNDGCYFCLGDNRQNSADSRVYGCFTKSEIMAKLK